MALVVPARVERSLLKKLRKLVDNGYYVGVSDAVRDLMTKYKALDLNTIQYAYAEVIASLIAEAFKEVVSDVILYGSVAKGEAGESSDVDLLVLTRGRFIKLQARILPISHRA
jgi:Arc/MetJ-type ribon-helix-helix transcriptional regulator